MLTQPFPLWPHPHIQLRCHLVQFRHSAMQKAILMAWCLSFDWLLSIPNSLLNFLILWLRGTSEAFFHRWTHRPKCLWLVANFVRPISLDWWGVSPWNLCKMQKAFFYEASKFPRWIDTHAQQPAFSNNQCRLVHNFSANHFLVSLPHPCHWCPLLTPLVDDTRLTPHRTFIATF